MALDVCAATMAHKATTTVTESVLTLLAVGASGLVSTTTRGMSMKSYSVVGTATCDKGEKG